MPWKEFLAQQDENESQKRLTKHLALTVTAQATEVAAAVANQEVSQDRQVINQLIKDQVDKSNKTLLKELEKLKNQLKQKKSTGKIICAT